MSQSVVAELAPHGVLRAAINMSNFLLVTGRSPSGDPDGVSPDMAKAIAMIKSKPAFKDYKRDVESHVGQNHKIQGNFYDPDGTRVELMEDHTADGFPSPMSTAPLFVK